MDGGGAALGRPRSGGIVHGRGAAATRETSRSRGRSRGRGRGKGRPKSINDGLVYASRIRPGRRNAAAAASSAGDQESAQKRTTERRGQGGSSYLQENPHDDTPEGGDGVTGTEMWGAQETPPSLGVSRQEETARLAASFDEISIESFSEGGTELELSPDSVSAGLFCIQTRRESPSPLRSVHPTMHARHEHAPVEFIER